MRKEEKISNFLGTDTVFEGKLTAEGTIRMDSHFKGEIHGHGTLIVGEQGLIEADVHAKYIIISGEVRGNVAADERLELRAPAKVFGHIEAPSVMIDKGVIFEGTCRMNHEKDSEKKSLTVVSSDKSKVESLPYSDLQEPRKGNISETNL
jgi:cytoskeletal protein CcmA (bactofilin family)